MAQGFRRPKSKAALDSLEAGGLWNAIALTKSIGEGDEKITLAIILRIHRIFFINANPDIAGVFRKTGQDVKKLQCMEPPPGRLIEEKMYEFWRELDRRISTLPRRPKGGSKTQRKKWANEILDLATWTQYQIAAIHPFCEGNGRMARLMTNLILYRFNFQPSQIKYEGENKNLYLDALCQIDRYGDYAPLKKLIAESVYETYEKVYKAAKNASGLL
ncbi:MAG: Fic family protein [Candidatus Harrisonbacteria bacterium]|nr:Fic family protein [Candidatus Harrisonbacteria bacterium]MBI2406297.1 Fic family protein [Candidatus Harrisonbacteria bacterium]